MWGMPLWRREQPWHTNTPRVTEAQSGSEEKGGKRGRERTVGMERYGGRKGERNQRGESAS
jgi:hypothetical protein